MDDDDDAVAHARTQFFYQRHEPILQTVLGLQRGLDTRPAGAVVHHFRPTGRYRRTWFHIAATPGGSYSLASNWQDITTGTVATVAPSYGNVVTLVGGGAGDGRPTVSLDTTDQLFKADQYRPLVIAYRNGSAVRVGDVADVTDSVSPVELRMNTLRPASAFFGSRSMKNTRRPSLELWNWPGATRDRSDRRS